MLTVVFVGTLPASFSLAPGISSSAGMERSTVSGALARTGSKPFKSFVADIYQWSVIGTSVGEKNGGEDGGGIGVIKSCR